MKLKTKIALGMAASLLPLMVASGVPLPPMAPAPWSI